MRIIRHLSLTNLNHKKLLKVRSCRAQMRMKITSSLLIMRNQSLNLIIAILQLTLKMNKLILIKMNNNLKCRRNLSKNQGVDPRMINL